MNLVIPECIPNIEWWKKSIRSEQPILLLESAPFQKMSYRNRYEIANANGKLLLSIPIYGGRNQKLPMNEIIISYKENWQRQHWKSLESSYRNTPHFSHYEHFFAPFYQDRIEKLLDWNLGIINVVNKILKLNIEFQSLQIFDASCEQIKKGAYSFKNYHQPFEHKNGFFSNLSIIDLIFCEGPAAPFYLKS